ncbi:acyl dehydratase [Cellulomonas chitinilytica]|uniref:Acyl dehydratase n=1 Tax=Cellulomonas chitinilytica TaxID=398759 RepID=A0A919U1M8_9CELL|nr:MaoC/PaaZ C-terminal domain-containing protein [Cellulomonas chitinilytica]GIG21546.1 acyl dehydratase [Cellulomonas chitinilytica]
MTSTVVLPGVPALAGVYARGAGASGRLAVARRLGRAPSALPDVVYTVSGVRADPQQLTAYQHLLGEPASDRLPAGFVHVLAFPVATALMARTDFPLPLAGLVHLSNHVEQHRPVTLDDPLDVRAWAADLRAHRSGTQVDLVTEVRTGDTLAWRGVSTYLARGIRLGGDGAPASDEERVPFVPPTPTGRWRLAADTGRRYAAVSGDRNPIHLSSLSAKALGFPRAIAHGMYTAARALADVGAARGDAYVWSVEFAGPVLLPGTVTVRVAHDDADGFTFAGWDARSGKPHLTGTVTPLAA